MIKNKTLIHINTQIFCFAYHASSVGIKIIKVYTVSHTINIAQAFIQFNPIRQ